MSILLSPPPITSVASLGSHLVSLSSSSARSFWGSRNGDRATKPDFRCPPAVHTARVVSHGLYGAMVKAAASGHCGPTCKLSRRCDPAQAAPSSCALRPCLLFFSCLPLPSGCRATVANTSLYLGGVVCRQPPG